MALDTFSTFYLTEKIDPTNNIINFSEGGPELSATVESGLYSLEKLATEIQTALNAAGSNVYTVSFLRPNRQFIIDADANFELLLSSGTQIGVSPFDLLGFTQNIDLTGSDNYSGASKGGRAYETQFPLQDYVDEGEQVEKVDPSVNETASGEIETITYGDREILEMTFNFITDLAMDGKVIRNNPNGLANAKEFFANIIQKGSFEFMKDSGNLNDFITVKLESTPTENRGLGYKLVEEVGRGLPGIYSIGPIILRVIPVGV